VQLSLLEIKQVLSNTRLRFIVQSQKLVAKWFYLASSVLNDTKAFSVTVDVADVLAGLDFPICLSLRRLIE
jgi:hypothetical protein